jgi:hypothetical protein
MTFFRTREVRAILRAADSGDQILSRSANLSPGDSDPRS